MDSPHKWPVTRKMLPFDDPIMDNDPFSIEIESQQPVTFHCQRMMQIYFYGTTSRYLNQRWLSLLAHIYVTRRR